LRDAILAVPCGANVIIYAIHVNGSQRQRLLAAVVGDGINCPPLIAGSCARERREPRQVRKEATVPVNFLCRRYAWLSFDGHFREERVMRSEK